MANHSYRDEKADISNTQSLYGNYISEYRFTSSVNNGIRIYDVNIYASQMEEDIDALEYVLNNIYSGKDFLEKRGISISERLNEIKAKIKSVKSMNKVNFFELLCSALEGIKDSHLVFSLPYFEKTHRFCTHNTVYFVDIVLQKSNNSYVVVDSQDSSVKCGDVISSIDEGFLFKTIDGKLLYGVFSSKPIKSIICDCSGKKIQLNAFPAPLKQISDTDLWSHNRCNGIDIITIHSLAAFNIEEKQSAEKLVALGKELKNSKKIILDLRGNRGGDSEIAKRFIENLNGSAHINLNYAKLNSQGSRLAEISLYAKDLDDYNKAREEILHSPISEWQCSKPQLVCDGQFKNQLVVLTDRNTASSAEIMLKGIKDNIPQSIIIGENTSGTLNTGDVRYFYLPNSLIFLNIPTAIFAGIFEEGTGFYPDFWSKDDAMNSAIDFLSQNN